MEERKRKALNISLLILVICLAIIAVVESFVLISLKNRIEDLNDQYQQIEDQLENL